jgi:hypothetical protein
MDATRIIIGKSVHRRRQDGNRASVPIQFGVLTCGSRRLRAEQVRLSSH